MNCKTRRCTTAPASSLASVRQSDIMPLVATFPNVAGKRDFLATGNATKEPKRWGQRHPESVSRLAPVLPLIVAGALSGPTAQDRRSEAGGHHAAVAISHSYPGRGIL